MAHEIQNGVLIIGAGLAGLMFAQSLRKNNVPFSIFERDTRLPDQDGWAIGLVEAVEVMVQGLPDDMGHFTQVSVNDATGEPDSLAVLNAATGEVLARMGGVPLGSPGFFLRANRARLRKYLAQNVPILFNKNFESCTKDGAGVTAHFSDGTSARGSLLVGADGSSSKVRHHFLGPEHVPERSKIIAINGVVTLQRPEFETLREIANSIVLAGNSDCMFNIGTTSVSSDGQTADFYWGAGFSSQDFAKDLEWLHSADAEALLQRALDLTAKMPSYMREFILKTSPQGVKVPPVRFVEYMPPESMPTDGRTTLIGDAAHAMIPYKGAGANTALQDSCDLAQLITEHFHNSTWDSKTVAEVLNRYHQVLLPRGRRMVAESHTAGEMSERIIAVTHGRLHEKQ